MLRHEVALCRKHLILGLFEPNHTLTKNFNKNRGCRLFSGISVAINSLVKVEQGDARRVKQASLKPTQGGGFNQSSISSETG